MLSLESADYIKTFKVILLFSSNFTLTIEKDI
jgi:hypothetical protein